MNKVILLGNLTKDPEIRYSQHENSMAVARFTIAVSRKFTKDNESDFFNCVAFGKSAEFVEKYFKKGSKMALIGRVQNDNYTNKNGEKVYSVQIIAEEIEFAQRKEENQQALSKKQQTVDDDGFMEIPENVEEGLPFN